MEEVNTGMYTIFLFFYFIVVFFSLFFLWVHVCMDDIESISKRGGMKNCIHMTTVAALVQVFVSWRVEQPLG